MRPRNPTCHRTGPATTCSDVDPVLVPRLLVNYVNTGPLERCDLGVHVYECEPSRLTWLTHVAVGPVWLIQYVYLAATCADWDPRSTCQGCGSNLSTRGSLDRWDPAIHVYHCGPIRPTWLTESASRPLMDFGELNDNMIKGLMILLKLSWAGIHL